MLNKYKAKVFVRVGKVKVHTGFAAIYRRTMSGALNAAYKQAHTAGQTEFGIELAECMPYRTHAIYTTHSTYTVVGSRFRGNEHGHEFGGEFPLPKVNT